MGCEKNEKGNIMSTTKKIKKNSDLVQQKNFKYMPMKKSRAIKRKP